MASSSQSKSVNITGYLVLGVIIALLAGAVLVRLLDVSDPQPNSGAGAVDLTDTSGAVIEDTKEELRSSDASAISPREGFFAPDFSLLDPDGQPVSLRQWHGRPVLINFWASWCGPCEVEMPVIQNAYQAFQDEGLVVLAVAVDDKAENVRRFFDERDLSFQPLMDDGNVSRTYQVFGLPTSFFVAADGKIAAVHTGLLTEAKIDTILGNLSQD
jgi:peroxiredoxin